jgi:hypothetical protein
MRLNFKESIMKQVMKHISALAIFASISALSGLALAGAGSMALSTKDLSDDVRASIAKEMAKAKQFKDEKRKDSNGNEIEDDSTSGDRRSSSCQMDVGATDKPRVGQRTPSRTVTVVQGNIVQMCGR